MASIARARRGGHNMSLTADRRATAAALDRPSGSSTSGHPGCRRARRQGWKHGHRLARAIDPESSSELWRDLAVSFGSDSRRDLPKIRTRLQQCLELLRGEFRPGAGWSAACRAPAGGAAGRSPYGLGIPELYVTAAPADPFESALALRLDHSAPDTTGSAGVTPRARPDHRVTKEKLKKSPNPLVAGSSPAGPTNESPECRGLDRSGPHGPFSHFRT